MLLVLTTLSCIQKKFECGKSTNIWKILLLTKRFSNHVLKQVHCQVLQVFVWDQQEDSGILGKERVLPPFAEATITKSNYHRDIFQKLRSKVNFEQEIDFGI